MRYALGILTVFLLSCSKDDPSMTLPIDFYLGADLSYVNEMIDCGASYKSYGEIIEPYSFFANQGCNLVRARLWHSPTFSNYSNYEDVEKTIQAAKNQGMAVLLDFHYSDTWAHPGQQIIPNAWSEIADLNILGDSVYQYTMQVLSDLLKKNLTPEIVQVGNEINSEILMPDENTSGYPVNWSRNTFLINNGLKAVEDFNQSNQKNVEAMLHIAQPENVIWWFEEAIASGMIDFDWIGISYYPQWSTVELNEIEDHISTIIKRFDKRVMIVETAYPYSLNDIDEAGNIIGEDALIEGYPATPDGQLDYLLDLKESVKKGGGGGVVYWEPAWISTNCRTQWGVGSHFENATFFNAFDQNEALPAFSFFSSEQF